MLSGGSLLSKVYRTIDAVEVGKDGPYLFPVTHHKCFTVHQLRAQRSHLFLTWSRGYLGTTTLIYKSVFAYIVFCATTVRAGVAVQRRTATNTTPGGQSQHYAFTTRCTVEQYFSGVGCFSTILVLHSQHYAFITRCTGCQLLEGQKVEGQDGRSLLKNLKCDSILSVTPTNTPLGPGTRGEAGVRLSPGQVSHTRPSPFLHPTCPQEPEGGWPAERRDCLLWWVAPRLVCLRQRQAAVPEESDDGLTG